MVISEGVYPQLGVVIFALRYKLLRYIWTRIYSSEVHIDSEFVNKCILDRAGRDYVANLVKRELEWSF